MLFVVSTSFKTRGEFIKSPFSISFAHPENYSEAWTKGGFSVNAVNSLIVAVVAVVFQVATASLTIFAIGVLKYKGSNILFYLTLFSMFISGEVTTIPLFLLIREFGLIDSLWALLLPVMIAVGGTVSFRCDIYQKYSKRSPRGGESGRGEHTTNVFLYRFEFDQTRFSVYRDYYVYGDLE